MKKNLLKTIIGTAIYKISLDLIYVFCISKYFAYSGFTTNIYAYKYIISTIVTMIMAVPIYKLINTKSISNIIITFLNLFYFIPGCSLYGLMGESDWYFAFFVMYWILILFFKFAIGDFRIKKSIESEKTTRLITIVILLSAVFALFISGYYNNFNFNLNIDDVYEMRAEANKIKMPSIFYYLKNWVEKIIPIAIVLFLMKKKYMLAVILTFAQLLLFSFGGSKTVLFILAIALFSYKFLNENTIKKLMKYITILNIILVIFGMIFSVCPKTVMYIHRRVMYMPNQLSYYYYDYFKINECDYLRQSFLRHFGAESPYNRKIAYVIGDEYFNKPNMSSNTGLVGDAFSNFGWYSLIFYPLLLVLALKCLDATAYNLDKKITFVASFSMFNSLTNGSFFSVLLSEGFIIIVLLFAFISGHKKEEVDI